MLHDCGHMTAFDVGVGQSVDSFLMYVKHVNEQWNLFTADIISGTQFPNASTDC